MTEPPDYLAAQLHNLLAEGELAQLAISVEVAEGRVVLAGCVESEVVRRRVRDTVHGAVADLEVYDELVVVDAAAPADHEELP
jgi:osmotically-inducible protein OsmY